MQNIYQMSSNSAADDGRPQASAPPSSSSQYDVTHIENDLYNK